MTKINWHPYPLELPDSGKNYLVTVEAEERFRYVYTAMFMYVTGWLVDKNYKVIAWAELPEPFDEGENGQDERID